MLDISKRLGKEWKNSLKDYLESESKLLLEQKYNEAITDGKEIYPRAQNIFKAFDSLQPENIKVVIIGQDPYHNPDQAMGLSFSVPKGTRVPPSLKNIFKELKTDINFDIPDHGDLTEWSKDGVFLLNAILTVEENKPGSHKKWGWQDFTNSVIESLSNKQENIVFMLWGNFAKEKAGLIDGDKHLILSSPHPSPLARGGFFNQNHFSKANEYLTMKGRDSVKWTLTSNHISAQMELPLK